MIAALLACHLAVAVQASQSQPAATPILQGLAISGINRGQRGPSGIDPVQLALVRGAWKPPVAGQEVVGPNGPRQWVDAKAGEDGSFAPQTAQAGYLYATVESSREQPMLLELVGAGMAYVNGFPRMGDLYGSGSFRLPLRLRPGKNEFLIAGSRGNLRARLIAPRSEVSLDPGDATLPDLMADGRERLAGIPVLNATANWQRGLTAVVRFGNASATTPVATVPPLMAREVAVRLPALRNAAPGPVKLTVELRRGADLLDTVTLETAVVAPTDTHRRTFVSDIDGSVQYYAVVPAKNPAPTNGLVLTLHGAGVEAIGQARAYQAKDDLTLVAPTNRRPFGFDWEDWGRLDAYEVLADARKHFPHADDRIILTGHSMGGHGTWFHGTLRPDLWAAIGPVAGWASFWTYGGAFQPGDDANAVQRLIRRSMNGSDVLARANNLLQTPIFALHGDADDNVPVTQLRLFRDLLAPVHPNFVLHERNGTGHWWNEAVDFPAMFSFFAPLRRTPITQIDFTTPNPALSAGVSGVVIAQQVRPLAFSRVRGAVSPQSVDLTTENVATLRVPNAPTVRVDGQPLPNGGWLRRQGDRWTAAPAPSPDEKTPARSGPFKEAFQRRMIFVVGTQGNAQENAWAMAKARFDAEQWWVRGNGAVDVVPDRLVDLAATRDRGLVVYGHSQMVARYRDLVGNPPIEPRRGSVRVGDRVVPAEDAAVVFAVPRPGSQVAMTAVVAGTGPAGLRLAERLPYFVSGNAYPDWAILRPAVLQGQADGFVGAGFFDNRWQLGESAWAEPATNR